jgi:hypothetical protein
MSAFKQFLSTDVIVSPLVVNKSFTFEGTASLVNNNIGRLVGYNVPYSSSGDTIFTPFLSNLELKEKVISSFFFVIVSPLSRVIFSPSFSERDSTFWINSFSIADFSVFKK